MTLTYTAELLESEELEADEEVKNAAEVPLYYGLPEPERSEAPEFREYEGPQAEKDVEVTLPKIGVVKTTGAEGFPDSATAEVGKGFKWRVVVKNESAVAGAKAAGVTDVMPAGWEYVAGSTEFKAVRTTGTPSRVGCADRRGRSLLRSETDDRRGAGRERELGDRPLRGPDRFDRG